MIIDARWQSQQNWDKLGKVGVKMIGTSLFIGKNIELTAINPEKDVESLSVWTADQEFVKEFLGGDFDLIRLRS